MNELQNLIEESRPSMTDFFTLLPNLYGTGVTQWTVKWDKINGAANINFEILTNPYAK